MTDAITFMFTESKRFPKKSGIVLASRCWVMILVLLPRIFQAIRDPIKAFPRPAQVADIPKFHPNCPAYPTKITALKYEVPKAKAVIHGPAFLPPRTKPSTVLAFFLVLIPTPIITAKNMTSMITEINLVFILASLSS